MMRWNPAAGLLVLFVICGCSQPCFLTEKDYNQYCLLNGLPRDLESTSAVAATPPLPPDIPGTVEDPERPPRYISLQEAIAIALQQGMIGSQSVRFPGVAEDLVSFGGPLTGVVGSDSIRVFSLNPALIGANIDRELARFDTLWSTSMSWNNTDELVQGLGSFTNGMAASLVTSLVKPLATGGVAGITYENDYRLLSRPPTGTFGVLSPSYTSKLTFGVEQPLLRGAGVDINQVLPVFSGSNLFPGINGRRATGEGILLARTRFDQQRADFERVVNFQLLNVESQYWTLYGSYVSLYALDQAVRMSYEVWKVSLRQEEVGKIGPLELAGARAQYEQFRASRIQALDTVLENERLLRVLLGMVINDGKRLVPSDAPTLAPYQPDWAAALQDAFALRPELLMARQDLRTRQLNLIAQETFLKPDLRFQGTYTAVGTGSRLDGNGQFLDGSNTWRTGNALRAMASDHFNDWTLGLVANVPIGFRFEQGTVRQAKLQLAQAYGTLKEQEIKLQNQLAKQYRLIRTNYEVIRSRRAEREAWAERLNKYFEQVKAGKLIIGADTAQGTAIFDAQRQWTTALQNEYTAIVAYNTSLAQFQFVKGTIMPYNSIQIAEGPIPQCAQVRAVEHERERTHAVVLRERAAVTEGTYHGPGVSLGIPIVPTHEVPTLPALEEASRLHPLPSDFPGKPTGPAPASDTVTLPVPVPVPALRAAERTVQSPPAGLSIPVTPPAPAAPQPEPARVPPLGMPAERSAPMSSRLGIPVGG
jgi:outer membrane protein TolC